jgi:broad specificity phosphatase PhoE
MTRLILIRHSAPAYDPCVAASQWPLSEIGRQRSILLARVLAPYQPFALFTSREAKAAETAALVARELGMSFAARPGLQEHARHSVGWLEPAEFKASVAALFARPSEVVFGDESADQAQARFAEAIRLIQSEVPLGNLAVVAHGTVISLFAGRVAGLDPAALLARLGLPAVIVLDRQTLAIETILEEVQP